jgi:hypothetical protein
MGEASLACLWTPLEPGNWTTIRPDGLHGVGRYVTQTKPFLQFDACLCDFEAGGSEEIPAGHLIFSYIRVSAASGVAAPAQATHMKYQAIFTF